MNDNGTERLVRELRNWAERPPSLSPRAARTSVLARLPSRRRRPSWRLLAAGAALTASALAVALIIDRPSAPVAGPPSTAPTAQRVIVHQLSSGTKLYIVMQPGTTEDES